MTLGEAVVPLEVSPAGHHVFNALGDSNLPVLLATGEGPAGRADCGLALAGQRDEATPAVADQGNLPVVLPLEAGGLAPSAAGAAVAGKGVGGQRGPLLTAQSPNLPAAARKLHIQYSHASADRLCALLRKQGSRDWAVLEAIRTAVAACQVCREHGPPPTHAVVTLPTNTAFNEALAVDLLFENGNIPVLHTIDMHSRFSKCTVLPNKTSSAVCTAFLQWVVTFGAPARVLADGGGEFDSDLWPLLGDLFGTQMDSTAAQAPWSNGVCERHNAAVRKTLGKLRADSPGANIQLLLDMACMAKNSLLVHGAATPYQLMCGSQPRLPSTLTDAPPALSSVRVAGDTNLQETLRLLAASRVSFLEVEADQSLRWALARKTRSPGVTKWPRDAQVHYWHKGVTAGTSGWRGPARVGGQTGRQVLLRHGGQWLTRDTGSIVAAQPGGVSSRIGTPALGPAYPSLGGANGGAEGAQVEPLSTGAAGRRVQVGPAPTPSAGYPPEEESVDGHPPVPEGAGAESDDGDVPDLVSDDEAEEDEAAAEDGARGTGAAAVPEATAAMWAKVNETLARLRTEEAAALAAEEAPSISVPTLPVPAGGPRRSARVPTPVDRLGGADPELPEAKRTLLAQLHALAHNWAVPVDGAPGGLHTRPPTGTAYGFQPTAILLVARAGTEDIDSVLRIGEHPSGVVGQVLLSRSELRRRQEVPPALAGRRFDGAMRVELEAWETHGVYEEVPFEEDQRVMSTRWVYTDKPGELVDDPSREKARLVIRGFEDPHNRNVVSTSPTVGRASLRVLLAMLVAHNYVPCSVDVRTAFLQGMPIDRVEPVYVQPPPQARVQEGLAWRLHKCAYGLTDAPRLWYRTVCVLMDTLGYKRAETVHGLFLSVQEGTFQVGLAVHVDDFLYGGAGEEVSRFEAALQDSFSVGPVTVGTLTFTGLRLCSSTAAETGCLEVAVDQDHYLDSIEEVDFTPTRAASKEAAVTIAELTLYRRGVWALLWASGQTQPHMACASSMLARRFHQAVLLDLAAVNRTIRAAKAAAGLLLRFTALPAPHRLVVFTDASAITNASATAQTGFLLFLARDTGVRGALAPDTALVPLAWGSHRQRRVTRSSFAAETYALLEGMRAAVDVACVLAHITDGDDSSLAPIDAFTDCLSLYNTMSAVGLIKPKEMNAAVAALREMYAAASMSSLTWLPAAAQLADPLTKTSTSAALRAVLRTGRYGLRPNGSMTKTHDTDRAELDAREGDATAPASAVLVGAGPEFSVQ